MLPFLLRSSFSAYFRHLWPFCVLKIKSPSACLFYCHAEINEIRRNLSAVFLFPFLLRSSFFCQYPCISFCCVAAFLRISVIYDISACLNKYHPAPDFFFHAALELARLASQEINEIRRNRSAVFLFPFPLRSSLFCQYPCISFCCVAAFLRISAIYGLSACLKYIVTHRSFYCHSLLDLYCHAEINEIRRNLSASIYVPISAA